MARRTWLHQFVRRDGHAAVIVRAAVKDVAGLQVRDAHQGIVGRGLHIVAVRGAWELVEPAPGEHIRLPPADSSWYVQTTGASAPCLSPVDSPA